jgi:hypothetical protein
VVTIQPSPASFNCAPSPVRVTIYKIDPTNYWAPGNQADLSWFLGVTPSLDVIAFGHFWDDLGGVARDGTNYYALASGYGPNTYPPYVLMRGAGPNATAPTIPMWYYGSYTNHDYNCYPPSHNEGTGSWTATWKGDYVQTPGYTGPVMKADYVETFSHFHEDWYFAQNVGPVRIINTNGITLDLVQKQTGLFSPIRGSSQAAGGPEIGQLPTTAMVTFRDILISRAGTVSGLNFDQWNYYHAAATHTAGPAPQDVCMNPANRGNILTVDQYLAWLPNRGTSCSTGQHWPMTELNQVIALAGTTDGLDFDEWNYYDAAAGYNPITPENSCIGQVSYYDQFYNQNLTVYPNRYAAINAWEWYGIVEYRRLGYGCQ